MTYKTKKRATDAAMLVYKKLARQSAWGVWTDGEGKNWRWELRTVDNRLRIKLCPNDRDYYCSLHIAGDSMLTCSSGLADPNEAVRHIMAIAMQRCDEINEAVGDVCSLLYPTKKG